MAEQAEPRHAVPPAFRPGATVPLLRDPADSGTLVIDKTRHMTKVA